MKGLKFVHQLFHSNHVKSFDQLRNEFNLPRSDFFRFLQLRHFLERHGNWDKMRNPSVLESFLIDTQKRALAGKYISSLYQNLLSMVSSDSLYIKSKWEADLQQEIRTSKLLF